MTSGDTIRLALRLQYDGSRYFGWQIQPERRTVQGVVQAAAERLTDGPCTVTGSGRTDRGVHATGQVASLTVPDRWTAAAFRTSMNAILPDDVWVERAQRVRDDFHPRYDARERTYRYLLGTAAEAGSPFHHPFCWALGEPLDRRLLEEAAEAIPGERSFEAFAKSGQPERGTRCHVRAAGWSSWGALGLELTVSADRYLHHMVRYLVGTMVAVAAGRRPLAELRALLERGTESGFRTSPPAPPRGLYLHRVAYPDEKLEPDPEEVPTAKSTGRPDGVHEEKPHR